MNLGFTFDENILKKYTLNTFLNQLPYPVNHYELAPDLEVLTLKKYIEIAKTVPNHHFHVPYFVEPLKYDFSHDHYQKHFEKLFIIIDKLRQYSIKKPTMVIHGASQLESFDKAHYNTYKGIDYLLNIIHSKSIDITLSLETLSNRSIQIGSRELMKEVIKDFNCEQLKICLDLCHDYYNFKDYKYPNDLLKDINYVHLHGMTTHKHLSIEHFPMEIIKGLQLDVDYTLELLHYQMQDDYLPGLKHDLIKMKNLNE